MSPFLLDGAILRDDRPLPRHRLPAAVRRARLRVAAQHAADGRGRLLDRRQPPPLRQGVAPLRLRAVRVRERAGRRPAAGRALDRRRRAQRRAGAGQGPRARLRAAAVALAEACQKVAEQGRADPCVFPIPAACAPGPPSFRTFHTSANYHSSSLLRVDARARARSSSGRGRPR